MNDTEIAALRKNIVQIVALAVFGTPKDSQNDLITSTLLAAANAAGRKFHLSTEEHLKLVMPAKGYDCIGDEITAAIDAMSHAAGGQTAKA